MKTPRALLGVLLLTTLVPRLPAQVATETAEPAPDSAAPVLSAGEFRSADELERLLAPIALYPDALIALILPAATVPADIVLGARHVRAHGTDLSQVEHRSWDESVKSLTHYPAVLQWMDENLQWTKQVGEAFVQQPAEVMQAIQRLRARARAAGTLVDTPEQSVLTDVEVIRIVPAQTDAIYLPVYQPSYLFLDQPPLYSRSFVSFGVGLPVGSWLAFECDWRRHTIWVGNRHRHWRRPDWRHPIVAVPAVVTPTTHYRDVRPWHPPAHVRRPPLPPMPRTYSGFTPQVPHGTDRTFASRSGGLVSSERRPAPAPTPGTATPPAPRRHPQAAIVTSPPVPPVTTSPAPPAPENAPPSTGRSYSRGGERHRPSPGAGTDTNVSRPRPAPPGPDGTPTVRTTPPASAPTYRASPPPSGAPPSRPNYGRSESAPSASRHQAPAPSRSVAPSAPATPPAAAPSTSKSAPPPAPATRQEGEGERSIGRRPPQESVR